MINRTERFYLHNKHPMQTTDDAQGSYLAQIDIAKNKGRIRKFKTKWTVPSHPEYVWDQNGILISLFLWNGLESSDYKGIIQPVLAWADGWYACTVYTDDNGHYNYSPYFLVKTGEELEGVIEYKGSSGGVGIQTTYHYEVRFSGERFKHLTQSVTTTKNYGMALLCFEPYTDNYKYFPPDLLIKMHDISLDVMFSTPPNTPLKWSFVDSEQYKPETPSGINGKIVKNEINNGEIDFYFR